MVRLIQPTSSKSFTIDEARDVGEFRLVSDFVLVSPDNPFVAYLVISDVLRSVLNARVVGCVATKGKSQFKIFRRTVLPEDERVPVGFILSGSFASNRAVFHRPEFGIAIPTGQVFPVKK